MRWDRYAVAHDLSRVESRHTSVRERREPYMHARMKKVRLCRHVMTN